MPGELEDSSVGTVAPDDQVPFSPGGHVPDEVPVDVATLQIEGLQTRVEGIVTQVTNLEGKVEKHSGEQRSTIIAVVVAAAFIFMTIGVEVMIYHTSGNNDIEALEKKQNEDYKHFQQEINSLKLELQRVKLEGENNAKH